MINGANLIADANIYLLGHHFLDIPCFLLQRKFGQGISEEVKTNFKAWHKRWQEASTTELVPLPLPKTFRAKHNLKALRDYRRPAPPDFWNNFPVNLSKPAKSLVSADKLEAMALSVGTVDKQMLEKVLFDLRFGAKIGCKSPYRLPSRATNAPSAYEDGEKVTDAICDWVKKGFAFGPVDKDQVPAGAKLSGIMTRSKPDGSVRIILNLSSPAGKAVNEGISSEDFPTTMSSTSKWLRALNKAGRFCLISKCDWSDAYKHVAVHHEDLHLQWFSWLGRYFCELCLVFGCVSSAGIYDRLAKVVLQIILHRSGMDPSMVIQHLDDVCAAAPAGSDALYRFDAEYFNVSEALGVKLAPRDDPKKSFGPSTSGVVLGVFYDTEAWTWAMPEEKLLRLLHDLKEVVDADSMQQERVWSIVGKIINVKPLVPGGHYNLYHLIKANSFSSDPKVGVPLDADLKRQAWFWLTALQVCSGKAKIPDPDRSLPAWSVDVFTDAAGGSWRTKGQGVGAVGPGFWVIMPWGRAINAGRPTGDGRKLDRIMSALELMGPLLALSAAAKQLRGKPVRFHVDNAGSVFIFKKGYSSSCKFSTAIVAAIASVAAGLGCTVDLVKITRCSNDGANLADALSKGAMSRFWELVEDSDFILPLEPEVVPGPIVCWATNPQPDFDLGEKILRHLAGELEVLGHSF